MNTTPRRGAFSLLELLMVMAIIGIVGGFAVPAVNGYLGSQRLSATASALASEFEEARQLSQTLNRNVEVRFYRCLEPELPGSSDSYRARQLFVYETNGVATPHSAAKPFDGGIILAGSSDYTTLLKNGESSPAANDLRLPRVGLQYHYFGVLFQPGGSVRLSKASTDRWCLTVVSENAYRDPTKLPPNFVTVQLDPHTGSVRLLQP